MDSYVVDESFTGISLHCIRNVKPNVMGSLEFGGISLKTLENKRKVLPSFHCFLAHLLGLVSLQGAAVPVHNSPRLDPMHPSADFLVPDPSIDLATIPPLDSH